MTGEGRQQTYVDRSHLATAKYRPCLQKIASQFIVTTTLLDFGVSFRIDCKWSTISSLVHVSTLAPQESRHENAEKGLKDCQNKKAVFLESPYPRGIEH